MNLLKILNLYLTFTLSVCISTVFYALIRSNNSQNASNIYFGYQKLVQLEPIKKCPVCHNTGLVPCQNLRQQCYINYIWKAAGISLNSEPLAISCLKTQRKEKCCKLFVNFWRSLFVALVLALICIRLASASGIAICLQLTFTCCCLIKTFARPMGLANCLTLFFFSSIFFALLPAFLADFLCTVVHIHACTVCTALLIFN